MNQSRTYTFGILTSGGDPPGMNSCLCAAVRMATFRNARMVGITNGYEGLISAVIGDR